MDSTRRILYGAVLMAVLTTIILAGTRSLFREGLGAILWPLSFLAGAAIGGAGVMRRRGARWPEPVLAALVSAVLMIFVLRVTFPGLGPVSPGDYPGAGRDYAKSVLLFLVVGGAGSFLLPLFDPAVRRGGPAPAVWKVVAAAAGLVALFVLLEVLRTAPWGGAGYAFFGLGTLVAGSVGAAILAGLGLLFTLVGARDMGAWAGAFGLFVAAITIIVWVLTGMRWFP